MLASIPFLRSTPAAPAAQRAAVTAATPAPAAPTRRTPVGYSAPVVYGQWRSAVTPPLPTRR